MKYTSLVLLIVVLWCTACRQEPEEKTEKTGHAPAVPSGLSASTDSSSSITISWQSAADVTGYYVYRQADTAYSKIATVSASSYTAKALAADTAYYFSVSAYNQYGESPRAGPVSATTSSASLLAAPSSISGAALSPDSIQLSWKPVSGAASYRVYRSTSADSGYSQVGTATASPYTDTGLSAGTAYYYKVSAVNAAGAEGPVSEPISATSSGAAVDAAKVDFKNSTQFYVQIHQDAFSGSIVGEEMAPGASMTIDARPSDNYGVGSTFCYTYRLALGDPDDPYNALAFAEGVRGSDPNMQENFVLEKGKTYTKNIKIPYQIDCNAAYIRIENRSSRHFELSYISETQKQLGNEEVSVPAGKTGIYKIPKNRFDFSGYKIISVFQEYPFPARPLENNRVYEYIFTDETNTAPLLQGSWKIRGEATSSWLKEAHTYDAGAFSDAELRTHLATDLRYGLSDKRSNYPSSKLIVQDTRLVSGSMAFNHFEDGKPYEMPVLIANDLEWNTSVFPPSHAYAGTLTTAYHTMFNDMAALRDQSYVVLASYIKGNRSGIWLFYFDANGALIDELDIPPSDTEGFMGIRLCALEDGGFLVLGGKKTYAQAQDSAYTTAAGIIYKFSAQKIPQWEQEYIEPGYEVTFALNGTETDAGYLVCASAANEVNAHTRVLRLSAADGTISCLATLSLSSENVAPHAIVSDETGNIYVTGILSHAQYVKAYIWKLTASGAEVWLKEYGLNNKDNFLFDLVLQDNALIAAGAQNSGDGENLNYYNWQYGSGWLVKIDTNTGFVLQDVVYSGVASLNSVAPLAAGGYVLSGISPQDNSHAYKFKGMALKVDEHLALKP